LDAIRRRFRNLEWKINRSADRESQRHSLALARPGLRAKTSKSQLENARFFGEDQQPIGQTKGKSKLIPFDRDLPNYEDSARACKDP